MVLLKAFSLSLTYCIVECYHGLTDEECDSQCSVSLYGSGHSIVQRLHHVHVHSAALHTNNTNSK